ncbi:hypothetical protein [Bradyrhizobium iriomotense]|uniref:Uncharacterized protein n=1 Tax=Bradyrhizobium iriomotense TaxID=441950 RepID=A0ABQ6BDW9_9BRAD|nr:hypothetical protein [Bradyrhizobium iriomotense]GLR91983.1 hypothetical protein GCM10007857_87010 [Bradyrhizobium iriomotense]
MQNLAGTDPVVAATISDSRQLIAADLRSLIAQIDTSIRLIEAAITLEDTCDPSGSTDVFVLDDVTPRYATASAALGACRVGLDLALESLPGSGKLAETGRLIG